MSAQDGGPGGALEDVESREAAELGDELGALPGAGLTLGDAWTLGKRLGDSAARLQDRPLSTISLSSSCASPDGSRPGTRGGLPSHRGPHVSAQAWGPAAAAAAHGPAPLKAVVRSGTTELAGPLSTVKQPRGSSCVGDGSPTRPTPASPRGPDVWPQPAATISSPASVAGLSHMPVGAPDGVVLGPSHASFTRSGGAGRQPGSAGGPRDPLQQPVWGQARPKENGRSITRPLPSSGTHSQPTTPPGSSPFFDGWGARRSRGAALRPGSVAVTPSGHRVPVAAVPTGGGEAAASAGSVGGGHTFGGGDMGPGIAATLPQGGHAAHGVEQGVASANRMAPSSSGPRRTHTNPAAVNLWAHTEVLTRPPSSVAMSLSGGAAVAMGSASAAAVDYRDPPAFAQLLRGGTATGHSQHPHAAGPTLRTPSAPALHYHMPAGTTAAAGAAGSAAFGAPAASRQMPPPTHTDALRAKSSAMLLAHPTAGAGARLAGGSSHRLLTPPSVHVSPDPSTLSPHAAAAPVLKVSPATARLVAMSPTLSVRRMEQPTQALAKVMQVQPLSGSVMRTSATPDASSFSMAGGLGSGGRGEQSGILREGEEALLPEAEDAPGPRPSNAPPPLPLMPHFAPPPPLVPPSAHASGATATVRGLSFGRGPSAAPGDATLGSPRSPPRSPPRQQVEAPLSPEPSAGPLSAQASCVDLAGQPIHIYTGQPSPRGQHSQRPSPRQHSQPSQPSHPASVKRPMPFSAAAAPVAMSPRGLASTSTRALVLGLAGAGTSAKQLHLMMGGTGTGAGVGPEDSETGDGADPAPPASSRRPDPTAAPSQAAMAPPPPQQQPSVAMLGSSTASAPAAAPEWRPQQGKGKSPGHGLASISATGPGYSLRKSLFLDEVETTPLEERLGLAAAIAAVTAGSGSAAAVGLRIGATGQGDQSQGAAASGVESHQPMILKKRLRTGPSRSTTGRP